MSSSTSTVNQLVFVVVSERQAEDLLRGLVKEHFYFTKIDSSGMVFQEPTLCLLIGLNESRLADLVALINQYCQPYEEYVPVQFAPTAGLHPLSMIEAKSGGALVYTCNVERFVQI